MSPANSKRSPRQTQAPAWLVVFAIAALGPTAMRAGEQPSREARAFPGRVAALKAKQAPRIVIDGAGRRVELPAEVRRVVSLAPNDTEILYAVGAGDKVAGITQFAEIPPGNAAKPSVGEPLEPSLEEIVALEPDLVFVDGSINRWETVASLARLKIPVYATDAHTVEAMLDSIRQIAELVGEGPEGEALAGRLEARLAQVRARLAGRPPKRVFFVVWEDPLIGAGPNSFIADALRRAGGEDVVDARQDWPHLSLEEIVRLQPEDLIFASGQARASGAIRQSLLRRPGWRDLEAVREGRVLVVSDAINRASPALVGAIEQLARQLHPEAFTSPPSEARPRRHGGVGGS